MSKYIWVQTTINFEEYRKIWIANQFESTYKTLMRFCLLRKYNNHFDKIKKVDNFDKWKSNSKRISLIIEKKEIIFNYFTKIYLSDLLK